MIQIGIQPPSLLFLDMVNIRFNGACLVTPLNARVEDVTVRGHCRGRVEEEITEEVVKE